MLTHRARSVINHWNVVLPIPGFGKVGENILLLITCCLPQSGFVQQCSLAGDNIF